MASGLKNKSEYLENAAKFKPRPLDKSDIAEIALEIRNKREFCERKPGDLLTDGENTEVCEQNAGVLLTAAEVGRGRLADVDFVAEGVVRIEESGMADGM